jgi:hypothetical protein
MGAAGGAPDGTGFLGAPDELGELVVGDALVDHSHVVEAA